MKQICLCPRYGGAVPGTIADAPQVEDKCRAPGGPKFEQRLQQRDHFYLQFAREGKELVWHLARIGDNLTGLAGPEEPQYGDRDRMFWRGSNSLWHLACVGNNSNAPADTEEPQYGDQDRTFLRESNSRSHRSSSGNDKLHRR